MANDAEKRLVERALRAFSAGIGEKFVTNFTDVLDSAQWWARISLLPDFGENFAGVAQR